MTQLNKDQLFFFYLFLNSVLCGFLFYHSFELIDIFKRLGEGGTVLGGALSTLVIFGYFGISTHYILVKLYRKPI
jgi:hypothetical protein